MIARLLVAAALLASSGTAQAYEMLRVNRNACARSDPHLFWGDTGVAVSVDPLPDALKDLAIEAWENWNASIGQFRFRAGNGAACTIDGVAAVAIADPPCGLSAFGDALAITRSRWNGDGTLVDADITFRPGTFVLNDEDVFRQVAMHELGHVLGLDHSDACGASGEGTLMRARLTGPVLEEPQADDIAGANAIYPGGSGGDGNVPAGTNSCAITSPPRGQVAPPLLAMALLLALRPIVRAAHRRPRRIGTAAQGIDGPRNLL